MLKRHAARIKRHRRIRKRISGTATVPRLCVYKSLNHLTVQIIDDSTGRTLVGLASYSQELRGKIKRANKEGARILGQVLAEKAKAKNIEKVVFDRGGHLFHGRISEMAEAARSAGLKF